MLRLIFRAWDSKNKKFLEGASNVDVDWRTSLPFDHYEERRSVTLQQCSGRKDALGKWIFEGDIILIVCRSEDLAYKAKVYFDEKELSWMITDVGEETLIGKDHFAPCYKEDSVFVVGNIFEGIKESYEQAEEIFDQLNKAQVA